MHSDQADDRNSSSDKRADNTSGRDLVTLIGEDQQIQDKSKDVDLRQKLRESLLIQKERASIQPQPGRTQTTSDFQDSSLVGSVLKKPGTTLKAAAALIDQIPVTNNTLLSEVKKPGATVETTATLINQTLVTNNTLLSEGINKFSLRSAKNIKTKQEKNFNGSILPQNPLNLILPSVSIQNELSEQKNTIKESIKSHKVSSQGKLAVPKKPKDAGEPSTNCSITQLKGYEAEKRTVSVEQLPLKPAFKDSVKPFYVNIVQKLPSIGPLSIQDLDDFLKKSKIDFEHLYHEKSVNDFQITDFNLKKTLGVGAFGRVVLGEFKKDKTLYALKVIDKQIVVKKNYIRYVSNEKRILHGLNFPFVISLKFFFTDYYYLYLVLPYIPGGNFFKYMRVCKKIKESDAKFYIGQLVLALEYLHHLELIHRDVKLENIVIDALGYLKLVDFGQCIRCCGLDKTFTLTGTPEYMAPEIIIGKGYDCAVDWWALGIITFEICAGFRPFKDESVKKLHLLILCSRYSIPNEFSSSLKKFILGLLAQEPMKRIANHSKKALLIKKHVWFKGMNWMALLNRNLEAPSVPKLQVLKENHT